MALIVHSIMTTAKVCTHYLLESIILLDLEFVDLYTDYVLNKSIEKQFTAFKEGFDLVCSGTAITIFRPEEMEQLVCGSEDLDFEVLQKSTNYDGGYSEETPVIKYVTSIYKMFIIQCIVGSFGRQSVHLPMNKRSDCCFSQLDLTGCLLAG